MPELTRRLTDRLVHLIGTTIYFDTTSTAASLAVLGRGSTLKEVGEDYLVVDYGGADYHLNLVQLVAVWTGPR